MFQSRTSWIGEDLRGAMLANFNNFASLRNSLEPFCSVTRCGCKAQKYRLWWASLRAVPLIMSAGWKSHSPSLTNNLLLCGVVSCVTEDRKPSTVLTPYSLTKYKPVIQRTHTPCPKQPYAHHAGIDNLSFPRLCPLQQRQDDSQSTGEAPACKVCQQVQWSGGFLTAATQSGQKACGTRCNESSVNGKKNNHLRNLMNQESLGYWVPTLQNNRPFKR